MNTVRPTSTVANKVCPIRICPTVFYVELRRVNLFFYSNAKLLTSRLTWVSHTPIPHRVGGPDIVMLTSRQKQGSYNQSPSVAGLPLWRRKHTSLFGPTLQCSSQLQSTVLLSGNIQETGALQAAGKRCEAITRSPVTEQMTISKGNSIARS